MRTTARALSVTAVLAGAVALSACGGADTDHNGMTGMNGMGTASSSATSTAKVDPADVMFAQTMVPHHQQAVQMADLALTRASSADVKALATKIKAAQDPEIATMTGWLGTWGAPTGSADMNGVAGMNHGSDGMMSQADMTKLSQASGAQFDRMWLTMMVAHHQGALTMANDVLATTKDTQVRTLAQSIIDGQTKEIAAMKGLLSAS
ncbi:Uncharacterized conserved protein, DUF305 family [Pedococcus dokdonensis]|uniref:Uncharacterized conserved protein, DUF305 family n=1 Tax=Pedococcus dokdonensis TaxID=443156 RepID=A0A1H0U9R3_9MICO|nr:DUF305 domain-containing protein [Pedococcus dokdonensis]SDP62909.1 Uncharacterized conserved protein, DUF305 family [Pedococcus dokdonensis]